MIITKKGTPPKDRDWKGRCSNCGTEAKAKESELKITFDQRDGDFALHPCPVCKTGIGIVFSKCKATP
jgi:hypothetical protein